MTSVPVKKALVALLRDPNNSVCADCKSQQHPRWASWSLGVFICIKCAGIHRSLGTHISKVKSVDLDTWKEEHLKMLVKMQNNMLANQYYECNLNKDEESQSKLKKLLLDTNKLQNFIKNKYEYKKWVGKSIINGNNNTTSTDLLIGETSKTNSNKSSISNVSTPTLSQTASQTSIISGDEFNNSNSNSNNVNSNNTSRLNFNKVPSSTKFNTINTNDRPDLKKSILSLYSKPSATASLPNNSNFNTTYVNNNNASQASFTAASNINNNNSALNINNTSMNAQSASYIANINNNNSNNNNSTISLDDNELFKNVWQ